MATRRNRRAVRYNLDAGRLEYERTPGEWVRIATSGGGGGGPPSGSAGGDLSGSYPNPSIATSAVTLGKMADLATDRLLGRDTAGTGPPEALTVGGGVEFTGSGGIQTSAFTGDVTKTAGGTATTVANNAVTDAKLRQGGATSVIGRSANSTGNVADIAASANDTFLGRVANALGFFTVASILATLLTTKGDIAVHNGTTAVRKGVSGTDGAFLMENSGQSDGLEWVPSNSPFYGDGGDGDATIAAGTTTLTIPKDYHNLTVNGTLAVAGFIVNVSGTLTFGASGIISCNGGTSAGGVSNQVGGGGAGANGFAGASTGGNGTQATNSWCALRIQVANAGKGGNGGQGNGAGSHPGGTGTTPSAPIASRSGIGLFTYDTGHTIGAAGNIALSGGSGGAAGGGDQAGATSGSGGGGGGVCLVHARKVDATAGGTIQANGGNGSNGSIAGAATAAGGGGGGGGGAAILVYGWAASGTLPTVQALGGTHGNGAGTGSNGTDGTNGYANSIRMAA